MRILVPDDGLRCTQRGAIGTNKRYPCGHPRTAENTRTTGKRSCCTLCRRRIERERHQRLKSASLITDNPKAPA